MEVFVYGTLKRGQELAYLLEGQTFVGGAATAPRYRLYKLGSFPGMVEVGEGGASVSGELWSVTPGCLAALDEVEGVAEHLYERVPVRLLPPYDHHSAETYLFLGTRRDLEDCGSSW
ncbi:hypothetical protein BH23VER1_BH23VER1_36200 [soil metagenome]